MIYVLDFFVIKNVFLYAFLWSYWDNEPFSPLIISLLIRVIINKIFGSKIKQRQSLPTLINTSRWKNTYNSSIFSLIQFCVILFVELGFVGGIITNCYTQHLLFLPLNLTNFYLLIKVKKMLILRCYILF